MMSMKLPMYMLAMTIQKRSAFSFMRFGPGVRPWSIKVPNTIAIAGVKGIPRAKRGT
jgi:hypothetical protein